MVTRVKRISRKDSVDIPFQAPLFIITQIIPQCNYPGVYDTEFKRNKKQYLHRAMQVLFCLFIDYGFIILARRNHWQNVFLVTGMDIQNEGAFRFQHFLEGGFEFFPLVNFTSRN